MTRYIKTNNTNITYILLGRSIGESSCKTPALFPIWLMGNQMGFSWGKELCLRQP